MNDNQTPPAEPIRPMKNDDEAVADIEHQVTKHRDVAAQSKPAPGRLRTREDLLEHYDADRPKKRHPFLRFIGWILLIVVLTGAGAAAGWYFWLRKEVEKTPVVSQEAADAVNENDEAKAGDKAAPTKRYEATVFSMDFTYPETWKVSTGADDKVIAVSPPTKLKLANGKTQTGQILFTIRHKQGSLPELAEGDAVAVRESEKIDYKNPSQTQRASTYLSFLSYRNAAEKGINAVYITGDFGYLKNQHIPQGDVIKSDPLISVSFQSCKDSSCSAGGGAVTLAATAWDDQIFSKPVKDLLASIVIQ